MSNDGTDRTALEHTRPMSVAQATPVDYDRALAYLGLSKTDPRAHALVLVAARYELDPILGHVGLYEGKPYIHFSGYLELANRDPAYAGMETVREWDDDRYCYATVRVWRTDRKYPFERTGKSAKEKPRKKEKGGGTYKDDDADAKAFAQACRRALRMAFNVAAPEPAEDLPTGAPEVVAGIAHTVVERLAERDVGADVGSAAGGSAAEDPPEATGDPGVDRPRHAPRGVAGDPSDLGSDEDPGGDAMDPAVPAGDVTDTDDPADPREGSSIGDDPAGAVPRPGLTGHPVPDWCIEHHLPPGTARLFLARQHQGEFGPHGSVAKLSSLNDLMRLTDDDARRAIELLDAHFTMTGEPRDWQGG